MDAGAADCRPRDCAMILKGSQRGGDQTCDSWSSLMFPRMVERRVRNHAETTVYDGRDYSQAA